MTAEEIEDEKKKVAEEKEIHKSHIHQSMIAGIKIEDDLEVDALGKVILEAHEEEDEAEEIVFPDEEITMKGINSVKCEQSLQESFVTGICDNDTINRNYTREYGASENIVLESLGSSDKLSKKPQPQQVEEEEVDELQESIIFCTKSKGQLAHDLPSFSQINGIDQSTVLNSNGLFNLGGSKPDNKAAISQIVEVDEESALQESQIIDDVKIG